MLSTLVAPSCRDPDELVLELTTDVPCAAFSEVVITVASLSHRAEADMKAFTPVTRSSACEGNGKLGRLVVARGSSDSAAVLAVLAYKNGATAHDCANGKSDDCIFARRRVSFLGGTVLTMRIALLATCKGVACDVLSTCRDGNLCYDSAVSCDNGDCADPGVVSSVQPPGNVKSDASTRDASGDADASDAGESGSTGDGGNGGDGGGLPNTIPCGLMPPLYCPRGAYCCVQGAAGGNFCTNSTLDCLPPVKERYLCFNDGDCAFSLDGLFCVRTDLAGMGVATSCAGTYMMQQATCRDDNECVVKFQGGATCRAMASSLDTTVSVNVCFP